MLNLKEKEDRKHGTYLRIGLKCTQKEILE